MANVLTTNPIYLDTFSADIVISSVPIKVKGISFISTNADDKLVLEDINGVPNVMIKLPTAKDSKHIPYGEGQHFSSLICDVSDGTYNTSVCLIYL